MREIQSKEALEANGFHESEYKECDLCGVPMWTKVTIRPFKWQSDIDIITFTDICPECGSKLVSYDSD